MSTAQVKQLFLEGDKSSMIDAIGIVLNQKRIDTKELNALIGIITELGGNNHIAIMTTSVLNNKQQDTSIIDVVQSNTNKHYR